MVLKINKNKKMKLENIICLLCKNLTFFISNEYHININCINKHKHKYSINGFIENQINENKIKCNICNNNKYLYNDYFYVCSCGEFIC